MADQTNGSDRGSAGDVPHVAFVLEQTLGHVTHAANLRRLVPRNPAITTTFVDVPFEVEGRAAKVPGMGNWTVRAGLRARRALRRATRGRTVDAMFVHTQVPAVLLPDLLRRTPTVVSLDATPLQYDELGEHYAHATGSDRVEHWKWKANRACFARAAHIVAWSNWTKQDLVSRYEVPPDKITVIPPGVDPSIWRRSDDGHDDDAHGDDGVVRILFVGGDLSRKGGHDLIAAFERLRDDPQRAGGPRVELHLATGSDVAPGAGIHVHHGLRPNSPELVALYHRADIFCLPTLGDCLPMVLSEAGAARLPLVSTDVGAIREIVVDGETGLLVPPSDVDALELQLRRLVDDAGLRLRLGTQAAALVEDRFDAAKGADQLVDLLAETARRSSPRTDRRVVLTVSGTIPDDLDEAIEAGRRPRADYRVMAEAFDAEVVDRPAARAGAGRIGRGLERLAGADAMMAWYCFRRRRDVDVVFTDGEQVGIPYAALTLLTRRRPAHLMIVHLLTVGKKVAVIRGLGLRRRIDRWYFYASVQRRFATERLGVPTGDTALTPFMVDTAFFRPRPVGEPAGEADRPLICSAGLELRDYPTLIEAVRGLPVDVVLAAASPWSKRDDSSHGVDLPSNVRVDRFDLDALRDLYARSSIVVIPLTETPFQAGITTILEAMAMGKPVIVSRTAGQTDTIVDDVNGRYVPPGDPVAMRRAIERLLDDHDAMERLGRAAREWVVEHADIEVYAARLADDVTTAVNAGR